MFLARIATARGSCEDWVTGCAMFRSSLLGRPPVSKNDADDPRRAICADYGEKSKFRPPSANSATHCDRANLNWKRRGLRADCNWSNLSGSCLGPRARLLLTTAQAWM